MLVRKTLKGVIACNDGLFAEIDIVGVEGIEKDLVLDAIQIHQTDTTDTEKQFQESWPPNMWVDIVTTTQVTPALKQESDPENNREGPRCKQIGSKSIQ